MPSRRSKEVAGYDFRGLIGWGVKLLLVWFGLVLFGLVSFGWLVGLLVDTLAAWCVFSGFVVFFFFQPVQRLFKRHICE